VLDSRSAEFEDDSVYFEVHHRCGACGSHHISQFASGDAAKGFAQGLRGELMRDRDVKLTFRDTVPVRRPGTAIH
jgi:hypothetical protein